MSSFLRAIIKSCSEFRLRFGIMAGFYLSKSKPLQGKVGVSGAKNAALPCLAASLLTDEAVKLTNIPDLSDVKNFYELLGSLGAVIRQAKSHITIDSSNIFNTDAPYNYVKKMRASFLLMGPLLARFGKASIPLPGGCAIGIRPVDLHLKGLGAMGAEIDNNHGCIKTKIDGRLKGNEIYLDFPSVGATENLMMAATLAIGTTKIENAAAEPEIEDLAIFLNNMGACISGAGTNTIIIKGVDKLYGAAHDIIPDRIEAGTFMMAAAATRGNIMLENVNSVHLKPVVAKLKECGIEISEGLSGLNIDARRDLKAIDVKTYPYPGFPTDMQAPIMAFLCTVEGTSLIVETIFENRFLHAPELKRMGGNVKIEGRSAFVEGASSLCGAKVAATDLRAGAALIIAGLAAEGITEIVDNGNIDRGYSRIDEKLSALGASISRI